MKISTKLVGIDPQTVSKYSYTDSYVRALEERFPFSEVEDLIPAWSGGIGSQGKFAKWFSEGATEYFSSANGAITPLLEMAQYGPGPWLGRTYDINEDDPLPLEFLKFAKENPTGKIPYAHREHYRGIREALDEGLIYCPNEVLRNRQDKLIIIPSEKLVSHIWQIANK